MPEGDKALPPPISRLEEVMRARLLAAEKQRKAEVAAYYESLARVPAKDRLEEFVRRADAEDAKPKAPPRWDAPTPPGEVLARIEKDPITHIKRAMMQALEAKERAFFQPQIEGVHKNPAVMMGLADPKEIKDRLTQQMRESLFEGRQEIFYKSRGQIERAMQPAREPGLFRYDPKTVGEGVENVMASASRTPVIRSIMNFVTQGSDVLGATAQGVVDILQGDPDRFIEEDIRKIKANAWGMIPGIDDVGPEDRHEMADLTTDLGLKPSITFDLGIIGTFNDKQVIDFGGEFLTDPFVISRLRMAQLTSKGVQLEKMGLLAKAKPGIKLGSDIAEQMRQGERALFSVRIPGKGQVALRIGGSQKYLDAWLAELFDMSRRGIAQTSLGRAFNISPGEQITGFRDRASGRAKDFTAKRVDEAADFWIEAEKFAADNGLTANEGAHRILMGQRRVPSIQKAGPGVAPGEQAVTGRSGPRQAQAKAKVDHARGLEDRAAEIRAGVDQQRQKIVDAAQKRADSLAEQIDFERKQADIRVQRETAPRITDDPNVVRELEALRQQPSTPQVEARIAFLEWQANVPPANMKQANALREQSAQKIRQLEQRRTTILKQAQARIHGKSGIGRDKLRAAVKLEQEADFMLRELDLRHPSTITQAAHDAAALKARGLFETYRKQGFSLDESVGSARAASLGVVDPIMAPFAHRFQDHFAKGYFSEVDMGIKLAELTDVAQHYIPRVLTPAGEAFLGKKGMRQLKSRVREVYANADFAKRRKMMWDGELIPEVNEWLRENAPGFTDDLFETNPFKIAARRARAAQGPVRVAEVLKAALEDFGRPDMAEHGWVKARPLLEESNLQAERTRGGGPAKPLIDAEVMRLGKENIDNLPGGQAAKDVEALRAEAVENLKQSGQIVATQFGRPIKGMDLDNIYVPPEIANELRAVAAKWKDPQTPSMFWRAFDGQTYLFKKGNTIFWPAFTARNHVHNSWMAHLKDQDINLVDPMDAARTMKSLAWGDGSFIIKDLGPEGSMTARQLSQKLSHRNALGMGQASRSELGGGNADALLDQRATRWRRMFPEGTFSPEVERIGFPESGPPGPGFRLAASAAEPGKKPPLQLGFGVTGKARKPIAAVKAPFRAADRFARVINESVEDYAKIRFAIDRMRRKGLNIDQAASEVRATFFDYSDLSPFEKAKMRRVAPFYTFARKNLPLMAESLITRPDKFAELAALERGLGDDAIDQSIIPFQITRGLFAANRQADDGIVRIYSGLGIGFEDFRMFDSGEDLSQDLFSRLNPALKYIGQEMLNKDLVFDVPLDESRMAPSRLRSAPKVIQDWLEFRPVYRDGQVAHYEMNPHIRNFIQNAPVFSATSRIASTSERFQEGTEGQPIKSSVQPAEPGRSLTGIKVYDLDLRQQMLVGAKNSADQYRRFLDEQVSRGFAGRGAGGSFFKRTDMIAPNEDQKQLAIWVKEMARTDRAIALLDIQMEKMKGLSAAERASLGGDKFRKAR